ncbi:hypothetical protein OROHE_006414 [Orobanche hederae]
MVVENGGTFSMNLNSSVTHSIASESRGIKFQAAKRQGDVIHYSWFADCCAQKKLLPLQPRYFLFLSDTSKEKLGEEIDEFSDSYYLDLNVTDLKQILGNMSQVEDSKEIEYYKKKLCPREEWVRFHGCCIYFHLQGNSRNRELLLELAIRRMKIEICSGGGSVAESLSHATHLVIVASPRNDVGFDTLLNSFSEVEKRLLCRRSLHIIKSQWLDDCFEKDHKLPEDSYSLIPQGFQRTLTEESAEQEPTGEEYHNWQIGSVDTSSSYKRGRKNNSTSLVPRIISLPNNMSERRKRGRPSGTSTRKGKPVVSKSRRTRTRVGPKPVKICDNESDKSSSLDDKDVEDSEIVENKGLSTRAKIKNKPAVIGRNELDYICASGTADALIPEIQTKEEVEDSTSDKGKAVDEENNKKYGQQLNKINEVVEYGQGSSSTLHKDRTEDRVDPLQAMLLNMLPILANKKAESSNPVCEQVIDKSPVCTNEEGKLSHDAGRQPAVKKQKVSLRDLAEELLKDW